MYREEMHGELDRALASSRIVLVLGLPRVGRSAFVRCWARDRGEAVAGSLVGPLPAEGILIFDHLSLADAELLIQHVRTAEAGDGSTRFIAIPRDLAAANRLRTALAGSAPTLEICPLQLGEFQMERAVLSAPSGPLAAQTPEPVATNTQAFDPDVLWLRGGIPESLDAESDTASLEFRQRLVGDLLARDYSEWGVSFGTPLDAVLRWLANQNGGELDETGFKPLKKAELRSVIYVFERLGLVRKLPNFPAGHSTSFTRMQKVHLRDTGLLHAVLGIQTIGQLREGVAVGDSFESFAIEALIKASNGLAIPQFYREDTGSGPDELDLVLDFGRGIGRLVAVEFKVSPNTSPRPGFYRARERIQATDAFVVHAGPTAITTDGIDRLDLSSAIQRIAAIAAAG